MQNVCLSNEINSIIQSATILEICIIKINHLLLCMYAVIHDALCDVQLHKIKSISVENIFKIEKHQLHLSFVCTMTTTVLLYAATLAATSIYITNIHKIHWLITRLSMPSRVDLYTITARMLHAIQMWQFESKNSQKRETEMRDREAAPTNVRVPNISFFRLSAISLTHSAMTFILNHVNQNVDTIVCHVAIISHNKFKKVGKRSREWERPLCIGMKAVNAKCGHRRLVKELVIQNCLLICNF